MTREEPRNFTLFIAQNASCSSIGMLLLFFLFFFGKLKKACRASQTVGLISPAFRSRLQTSLKRRLGLPADLDPVASSP